MTKALFLYRLRLTELYSNILFFFFFFVVLWLASSYGYVKIRLYDATYGCSLWHENIATTIVGDNKKKKLQLLQTTANAMVTKKNEKKWNI